MPLALHDIRLPLLVSSTLLGAGIGLAWTLAPTYSALHVYLILCGSWFGYVFVLLFITWSLHALRFVCCAAAQCVHSARRKTTNFAKSSSALYQPLKQSGTSGVVEVVKLSEHSRFAEENQDAVEPQLFQNDDNSLHRRLLVSDGVAIASLYVTLCLLAFLQWSPPTFDVSAVACEANSLGFPPTFKFGASTSSYQVEGNLYHNQWAQFENSSSSVGGSHIRRDQHCGAAADMWNLFESDLDERIVGALNLDAFRLSVEWSRIEPERGHFNETALGTYISWVSQLRDRGVEPIVTLHHFTNPLWFERLGAFENATASSLILPFVEKVVEKLGPYVDRWVTINEIMVYAGNGYLMGEFPPGRKGEMGTMLRVVNNMLCAHEAMYRVIKEMQPGAKVSIAKNSILYQPWSYFDLIAVVAAKSSDLYYNAMPINFLRRQRSIDYIGLNTYIRMKVGPAGSWMGFIFPPERQSDMGWDLDPQVLYQSIKQYHEYMPVLEIVITEHGVADGDKSDMRRVHFMRDSLLGLAQAVRVEGLPVVGYMHWSLLDNWEWSSGFDPKFGLYRIDLPHSQERKLTEGGKLYKDLIATRKVPV